MQLRFLLFTWTTGYIFQFCTHGALGIMNFTAEDEPRNRADPGCCPTFDSDHNCTGGIVSVPWLLLESFFCTGQTFASVILMGWLLFNHPRLHRNLMHLWGYSAPLSSVIDVSSIAPIKSEGDVYFGMLHKLWT
ncbi:hypothetical protein PRIPAC_81871 [Pristionchus pacificus]|uniref:Uncharacterized protein n=1 Tax=Pristionchus pacificus TaxID=54126 RepID=A0A2A6C3T9_PRIPA|nr:hypothetical protein PRIPAC_81871 [Pristionchus pacificus]|eukprot:PDM72789.1 hypothetical protein PRIPAC_39223 [Pristionchus pacificus]